MLLPAISSTLFFLIPIFLLILALQPNPAPLPASSTRTPWSILTIAQLVLTLIAVLAILVATLGLAALTKAETVVEMLFVSTLQSLVVYIIYSLSSYRLYVNALIVLLSSATLLSLLSVLLPVHYTILGIISPILLITFSLISFPLLSGFIFPSPKDSPGGRHHSTASQIHLTAPHNNHDADKNNSRRSLLPFSSLLSSASSMTLGVHSCIRTYSAGPLVKPERSKEIQENLFGVDLETATQPTTSTPSLSRSQRGPDIPTTPALSLPSTLSNPTTYFTPIKTGSQNLHHRPAYPRRLPALLFVAQFLLMLFFVFRLCSFSFPTPPAQQTQVPDQMPNAALAIKAAQTALLVLSGLLTTFAFSQYVRLRVHGRSIFGFDHNRGMEQGCDSNNLSNSNIAYNPNNSNNSGNLLAHLATHAKREYTNINSTKDATRRPNSDSLFLARVNRKLQPESVSGSRSRKATSMSVSSFPLSPNPEVGAVRRTNSTFSLETLDHGTSSDSNALYVHEARNGNAYPTYPPSSPSDDWESPTVTGVTGVTPVTTSPPRATLSAGAAEAVHCGTQEDIYSPKDNDSNDRNSIAVNYHDGTDEYGRQTDTPTPFDLHSLHPMCTTMHPVSAMPFVYHPRPKHNYHNDANGSDETDDMDPPLSPTNHLALSPTNPASTISPTINPPINPYITPQMEQNFKRPLPCVSDIDSDMFEGWDKKPSPELGHKESLWSIASSSPSFSTATTAVSSVHHHQYSQYSHYSPNLGRKHSHTISSSSSSLALSGVSGICIKPRSKATTSQVARLPSLGKCVPLDVLSRSMEFTQNRDTKVNGGDNQRGEGSGLQARPDSPAGSIRQDRRDRQASSPMLRFTNGIGNKVGNGIGSRGRSTSAAVAMSVSNIDNAHDTAGRAAEKGKKSGSFIFGWKGTEPEQIGQNRTSRKAHCRHGSRVLDIARAMKARSLPVTLLGSLMKHAKEEEEVLQDSSDSLSTSPSSMSVSGSGSSAFSSLSLTFSKSTTASSSGGGPGTGGIRNVDENGLYSLSTPASSPRMIPLSKKGSVKKKAKVYRLHGKFRRRKSRSGLDVKEENGPADFMDLRDPFAPPDLGARGSVTTLTGAPNGPNGLNGDAVGRERRSPKHHRTSVWGRLADPPLPQERKSAKAKVKTRYSRSFSLSGGKEEKKGQVQVKADGNKCQAPEDDVLCAGDSMGTSSGPSLRKTANGWTGPSSAADQSEGLDVEEALLSQRLLMRLDLGTAVF